MPTSFFCPPQAAWKTQFIGAERWLLLVPKVAITKEQKTVMQALGYVPQPSARRISGRRHRQHEVRTGSRALHERRQPEEATERLRTNRTWESDVRAAAGREGPRPDIPTLPGG